MALDYLLCEVNIMKKEKQGKQSVKPFVREVEGGIYIETNSSRFDTGAIQEQFCLTTAF